MTPTIEPYSDDGREIAVRTPYNEDFKNALKALVPPQDRDWDPDEQAWIVRDFDGIYAVDLVALMRQHFGDVHATI